MKNVNRHFYCLAVFAVILAGCTSDNQKEKPDKDDLEQQKKEDTLKIDVPMQAYLETK